MKKINAIINELSQEYLGSRDYWEFLYEENGFAFFKMTGYINKYKVDMSNNKLYMECDVLGWSYEFTLFEEDEDFDY